jgi:tetratricopeptide (TPR) repeat protein
MHFFLTLILYIAFPTAYGSNTQYVDNKQCLNCHQEQAKMWRSSHHFYSMLPAIKKNVLGDFNDVRMKNKYQEILFFKKNSQFAIKVTTKSNKSEIYLVKYTFGFYPLQQYLLQFPKGRLQVFNMAWDSVKHQWFNLANDNELKQSSPLHWTKRFYNWNHSCADCHSTDFKKNFDGVRYHSTFAGINVNCQACHGPGSSHVKWAKDKTGKDNGLIVNFAKINAKQQVEQCAHCHARRSQVSDSYSHDKPFNEQYLPALLRQDLYYLDGQIKDEVFVYGSFLQSKMYLAGVRCTDCHNPHSLKLKFDGNTTCTQCHNTNPKKRFSQLKSKNYESTRHTHHKLNSKGSLCVSCHMPQTVYMKVDFRADHSFKLPNPQLTIDYGIPNACNRCHQDKSAKWAKNIMLKWYQRLPQENPLLIQDEKKLLKIVGDKNQADIFRASALMLLRLSTKESIDNVIASLSDTSTLVKQAALRKVSQLPMKYSKGHVEPLLTDSNKIIRAFAANNLASIAQEGENEGLSKALNEYKQLQDANNDTPQSYFNLAQLALKQNNTAKAIDLLQIGIVLDKHFIPTYELLAKLYSRQTAQSKLSNILTKGIANNPDAASLYYMQGLVYAENKQYLKAKKALIKTLSIDKAYPRAAKNLSLVYMKLGGIKEALIISENALKESPDDIELLNNLIYITMKMKAYQKTSIYLQRLLKLQPDNKKAKQLLLHITSSGK